ncbi:MAG TPA: MFS transporter [Candidatus Acidoferrales bacterium]|jgi:fucose permease|nr:MFS transporter [Candidatus Acidoferrales bacterium]
MKNFRIVVLVMLVFVAVSFITNLMDPMGTDLQASFKLTETQLGYLSFAMFIAYAVMSLPAGLLVERFSAKSVLIAAFLLATLGAFAIAAHPSFATVLPAFFFLGVGFAMLQVVTIPLLRSAAGGEHMAFLGNMSQLIFALGSAVSPYVYVYLVNGLKHPAASQNVLFSILSHLAPPGLLWVSLYWVITVILLVMIVAIAIMRWPRLELTEDEKVGSFAVVLELLKRKTVWLYFIGVICYVGTEQGVATKIKGFLVNCHHVDPDLADKVSVSGFWGAMAVGCAVGLGLVKLFDSRTVLSVFSVGGILTLLLALFTPSATVALYALPILGFWCSVGCPIVFALALNSLERHHGTLTGMLCTGIVGGGFLPPIIGHIADSFGPLGLRYGMLAILVTWGYLFSMGLWARPLINNATIGNPAKAALPTEAHV